MTEFGKCKAADKWQNELKVCPHTEMHRNIQKRNVEHSNEFQPQQAKAERV